MGKDFFRKFWWVYLLVGLLLAYLEACREVPGNPFLLTVGMLAGELITALVFLTFAAVAAAEWGRAARRIRESAIERHLAGSYRHWLRQLSLAHRKGEVEPKDQARKFLDALQILVALGGRLGSLAVKATHTSVENETGVKATVIVEEHEITVMVFKECTLLRTWTRDPLA